MKVAVTGGTGFVGCHTVAALSRAGHSVALLVRSQDRVAPALEAFGIAAPPVTVGDVTDPASVEEALAGCDAVIHCASVYALDPRRERAIRETNVRGTEIVLGTAARLGCNPIVYVSSIYALIGEAGATLTPDSEPGHPMGVYFRSKAEAEAVARRHQAQGAPVVISYPGSVWGPDDPYLGESAVILRNLLRGLAVVFPAGTWMVSDVRDVARLHARLVDARRYNRYFAPTTTVGVAEVFSILSELTGRSLPSLAAPEPLLRPGLLLGEVASRVLGLPLVWSAAGGWSVALRHRADDSRTRQEFTLEPTPLRDTIRDMVRWLVGAGHMPARLAGKLAA